MLIPLIYLLFSRCIEPPSASERQLIQFHSAQYIDLLRNIQEQYVDKIDEDESSGEDFDFSFDDLEEHGLGDY